MVAYLAPEPFDALRVVLLQVLVQLTQVLIPPVEKRSIPGVISELQCDLQVFLASNPKEGGRGLSLAAVSVHYVEGLLPNLYGSM